MVYEWSNNNNNYYWRNFYVIESTGWRFHDFFFASPEHWHTSLHIFYLNLISSCVFYVLFGNKVISTLNWKSFFRSFGTWKRILIAALESWNLIQWSHNECVGTMSCVWRVKWIGRWFWMRKHHLTVEKAFGLKIITWNSIHCSQLMSEHYSNSFWFRNSNAENIVWASKCQLIISSWCFIQNVTGIRGYRKNTRK